MSGNVKAIFSLTLGQKAMAWRGFSRARAALVALLAFATGMSHAADARADGAFPTAQAILLDGAHPAEMVLATNFGLVASQDAGRSWSWGCETPLTTNAFLYYQLAPASSRIWALSTAGLVYSDDRGCSWLVAGGALSGATVTDYFVSRDDPSWVLAIARAAGSNVPALFASHDGATTFAPTPLFTVDAAGTLDGVEVSRGGRSLYVIGRTGAAHHTTLAVTHDRGATWASEDLEARLGALVGGDFAATLAAVDRDDDARVFLRVRANVNGTMTDGIATTPDRGATLTLPVSVPGASFAAFLQRTDGTLLLTGRDDAGLSAAYRSADRGVSFARWDVGKLRIMGLAERGSTLFAATDNFVDGMALGSSEDGGATWAVQMAFDRISEVQSCLRVVCATDCEKKAEIGLFSDATCAAGAGGSGAAPAKGGGCAVAPAEDDVSFGFASMFAAGAIAMLGRVGSRRRGRS